MDNPANNGGLIYVGPDRIIGVPARDLSADEVPLYGRNRLLQSGLYKTKKVYAPKPTKSAQKGSDLSETAKE